MMRSRLILLAVVVCATVACGDDKSQSGGDDELLVAPDTGTPDSKNDADLPARSVDDVMSEGPHRVGFQTTTVVYTPMGSDDERTIPVSLWYPTDDDMGTSATYVVTRPEVLSNATVLDEADLPVLVFSHGSGGIAEQSFFFTEFFASWGFIVAAPYHIGNSFGSSGIPFSTFENRPQDISATLDAVYDHEQLGLRASETDVVVAGHSFGGYTAFAIAGATYDLDLLNANCGRVPGLNFCDDLTDETQARFEAGYRDDRFVVAVPMAPFASLVYGEGTSDVEIPTFLMTAENDRTLPNTFEGDVIWRNLSSSSQHRRVDIAAGGHYTFTNACELPLNVRGDGCGSLDVEPAEAHAAINAYALAFVARHLWGDEGHADLLDGQQSVEPAVLSVP